MQIHCKECGHEVRAEDVNLERVLAKCAHCHAVFNFSDQLEPRERAANRRSRDKPTNLPPPPELKIQSGNNQLLFSRRWFSAGYIPMALFTLFWDGFMVMWYGIALTQGIWIMAVFGLLHAAVGVGLTYYVLTGFLNHSELRVTPMQLEFRHYPIPYPGAITLPAAQVQQLFCKREGRQAKGSEDFLYSLNVLTRDQFRHKLLDGLKTPESCWYGAGNSGFPRSEGPTRFGRGGGPLLNY